MSLFGGFWKKDSERMAKLGNGIRWKPGEVLGRTGLVVIDVKLGGMGIVYIVANPFNHSELYALKTFRDEFIQEERALKRFWIEAQNWMELERHENLVYAEQVFEIEGKPYIYLEFIDGGSLRDLISTQRLNLPKALDIAAQFCTGMEAVRGAKGIIHRDIKPENCLLTRERAVKITDWGLVKVFDEISNLPVAKALSFSIHNTTLSLTEAGAIMGTPAYMPPEQWLGEQTTVASDIYSFGCMFYEMLSGRLPFEGNTEDDLKLRHLKMEPETISGISGEINDIVIRCLQKKPQERFPNFGELGEAILRVNSQGGNYKKISQRVKDGWRPITSEELTQKGFGLLHLRRDREAIQYFRKAVELAPNNFLALGYMGYCLGNIEEHGKAIEACEKAIRINPDFAHPYGNLGYSYSKLKDFEKAIENYKKAIKLESHDVTHYNNIVIALNDYGDYEKNFQRYEDGLRYAELGFKIDRNYYRLWINKGNCLLRLLRYKEAITSFEHALSINPRAAASFTGLYLSYKALHNDEAAERYLRLASNIDPNFTT